MTRNWPRENLHSSTDSQHLTEAAEVDETFSSIVSKVNESNLSRRTILQTFGGGGGLAVLMGLFVNERFIGEEIQTSLKEIIDASDGPAGISYTETPTYSVDDTVYERHPGYHVDFMFGEAISDWMEEEGRKIATEAELLAKGLEKAGTSLPSSRPYTEEVEGKNHGYVRGHQALFHAFRSLPTAIQGYSFGRTDGRLDIQKEIAEGGHFTPDHLIEREPDVTDPEQLKDMLKTVSRLAGTGDLGVGDLDKRWIYSHRRDGAPIEFDDIEQPIIDDERTIIPDRCNRVVVGVTEMPKDVIRTSPTPAAAGATALGYGRMAVEATIVATWIRSMGYNAIPALNDTGISVPMAIDAGLGEGGRHGRLIHPQFGSNVRIWKILTDMPLESDPYLQFLAWDFCEQLCRICSANCPVTALSYEKKPRTTYRRSPPASWSKATDVPWDITKAHGVKKWYEEPMRCRRFWMENGAECTNCTTVCPFTHGREWLDQIFLRNAPEHIYDPTYHAEHGAYDEPFFDERWISQVMLKTPETLWEQQYLPFGLTQDRRLTCLKR